MFRMMSAVTACGLALAAPVAAQDFFEVGGPTLSELRNIRSTYIFELDPSVDADALPVQARALMGRFGGQVRMVYGTAFNGFSARMNDVAVARLLEARGTGVVSVTRNDLVTISAPPNCSVDSSHPSCKDDDGGGGGNEPVSCTLSELPWGVSRVSPLAPNPDCSGYLEAGEAAKLVDLNRFASSGLKVCVIDTGVAEHPDLIVSGDRYNFTAELSDDDLHGHGTHVAGTIGAIADLAGVVGVAPSAEITSIKVLDRNGSGSWETVIAGIDKAAAIHCDVANLSLGGARNTSVDSAVTNAAKQGVSFAIAAGNSGTDTDNYSPAAASSNGTDDKVYTVAAFAEGDKWASFSNYDANGISPIVDFALPGVGVKSTLPGGSYGTYDGTSMAAPHMAGLLVRYLHDRGASVPIDNSVFSRAGTVTREGGRGRWKSSHESYAIPADDGNF